MNQVLVNQLSKKSEKENIVFWRQYLKNGFAQLKSEFAQNPKTTKLFKQHCKLIDELLSSVWLQSKVDKSCCLIAVGGYGRGELYPYSDIDILILVPEIALLEEHDAEISLYNQNIEALVGLLWDLGLSVGHSVRSLSECFAEATRSAGPWHQSSRFRMRGIAVSNGRSGARSSCPAFRSRPARMPHSPASVRGQVRGSFRRRLPRGLAECDPEVWDPRKCGLRRTP